jgi:VanZ family protein
MARILGWCLAVAIAVLSFVPPELRPETDMPHHVEHFAAFFVTGVAFGFGYARKPVVITVSLVLFSAVIEIIQIFVPGRHSRPQDFVVDAFAVCAGVIVAALIGREWAKFQSARAD